MDEALGPAIASFFRLNGFGYVVYIPRWYTFAISYVLVADTASRN